MTLDPNGVSVDVIDNEGSYRQFNGSTFTLLAGPHFVFNVPSSTSAGQSVPVTLTVMDALNEQVAGYTGTVQFTNTDAAAGRTATASIYRERRRFVLVQ